MDHASDRYTGSSGAVALDPGVRPHDAGWLVDVLFEHLGAIPAKVLYKTGAVIVAAPVIYFLWKLSRTLYVHRIDVILFINDAWKLFGGLSKAL